MTTPIGTCSPAPTTAPSAECQSDFGVAAMALRQGRQRHAEDEDGGRTSMTSR